MLWSWVLVLNKIWWVVVSADLVIELCQTDLSSDNRRQKISDIWQVSSEERYGTDRYGAKWNIEISHSTVTLLFNFQRKLSVTRTGRYGPHVMYIMRVWCNTKLRQFDTRDERLWIVMTSRGKLLHLTYSGGMFDSQRLISTCVMERGACAIDFKVRTGGTEHSSEKNSNRFTRDVSDSLTQSQVTRSPHCATTNWNWSGF